MRGGLRGGIARRYNNGHTDMMHGNCYSQAIALIIAFKVMMAYSGSESESTPAATNQTYSNRVVHVGRPILLSDTFCGISFAERRPPKHPSRKVKDAYGFMSPAKTKLKKPFRNFKEVILTFTEHGILKNVSLVYVPPKIKSQKDIENATKEFTEVAVVIAKKYGMTWIDGSYQGSVLERKGSRDILACYEFDNVNALYRIQVVMEAWTCVRTRLALRGSASLPDQEDRYLVMIVSVDNKKADELEGKERVKTLNLEGGGCALRRAD